ncbi:MAG: amidohydrolase family protein [Oscillospiraceae bacterium]|nr:amidohydrolase family protein [Oscillospiraceae bacterium]
MLIYNAELHTMDGAVLAGGWVRTEGVRIHSAGASETCPAAGPDDIDAAGAAVTPGLIDAHCHIGVFEDAVGEMGEDGNEASDPVTPHMRGLDAVNPRDRCFADARRAGVTAVVTGPGSANPVGGQMAALKTDGRRVDDMVLRAPAAMKFAMGENPKRVYAGRKAAPFTRMGTAALIREALFQARAYGARKERAARGRGDPPDYHMKWESLLPVLAGAVPAHIHAHRADDIFTALRIAREFALNAVIIHGTDAASVADLLAAERVPVVAGPLLVDRSKPELKSLSFALPAALYRAGVPAALCTDAPVIPPEHLPLCAGLAAKAGLPAEEALRAVTAAAADIARLDHRVGRLRPGLDADMVIWRGRPLSLEAAPAAVFLSGRRAE